MGNALVLAELRSLANRLNRFEAEFNNSQSDTRTSTPSRRNRAKKNQGNCLNMINSQLSLNESVIPVTVTSAPTVSMATSRAINVTAGMSTVSMASATIITTVPLTRPTSTLPLVIETTGTVSNAGGPHMQMSLAGVPIVSYPGISTSGLALSVGGQTVMNRNQASTGLPQAVVCTSTLGSHQILPHPQQVYNNAQVFPPTQQTQ